MPRARRYSAPMFNDQSSPIAALATRRSGKPRDLAAPGPTRDELLGMIAIAARTPDHGKLAPWRFVVVPPERRDAFAALLLDAARAAGRTDLEATEQFARQAPALVVMLFSPVESAIPAWEQELSAGAAAMNLLHAAHAHGFAGGWLTTWAAYDDRVLGAFGRAPERIAGFFFIGTPTRELVERPRPELARVASEWAEQV